ncbi:unnamed protein product [Strongylus vulgaris]|uniref:Methyltransferase domain-containing protein n=1 Tax=Strongylus vulgaris TaxID=40348 RepID=A0A3P7IRH2_STRVU|nr:unnamed protein product [Strongylus vulgaris]
MNARGFCPRKERGARHPSKYGGQTWGQSSTDAWFSFGFFGLFHARAQQCGSSLVFDRELKKKQRDWAARQKDFDEAQYLKEEIGWRVADKVFDLTKFNPLALDIGCGVGHIAPHMIKENVGTLIQCDMSATMVEKSHGADDSEVSCINHHLNYV